MWSSVSDASPASGQVTLRCRSEAGQLLLEIEDEGPGIDETQREKIFEKFQRLESRKSMPGANRGLGLTFCRLAVEAHGGTIWVDDAPGHGAMFRALLPATEAEHGVEAASA